MGRQGCDGGEENCEMGKLCLICASLVGCRNYLAWFKLFLLGKACWLAVTS